MHSEKETRGVMKGKAGRFCLSNSVSFCNGSPTAFCTPAATASVRTPATMLDLLLAAFGDEVGDATGCPPATEGPSP